MLKDILLGIYFNLSFFGASYLLISSFISASYTLIEKVIFSFLLSVSNIIIFSLILNIIPAGITSTNMFIISQACFILSILIFILRRRTLSLSFKTKVIPKMSALTWLLVGVFFANIFISLWTAYIFPVIEADSLAYHLQSPPNWFQSQKLIIFPSNDQRTILYSNTQNFLVLWNFLSFGSDIFIELVPYFFLLFGVLIIFNFLQKIHHNTEGNFIISLLYYFVGAYMTYFSRAFTGDVGLSSLIIASLTMMYLYFKYGKFMYFIFFSLANGLLLGSKTTGVLYVFLVYIFAFLYEAFIYKKNSKTKIFALYLLSLTTCFALGGFYYLTNMIYFHNPFFGKEIDLLGLHLPGIKSSQYQMQGPNLIRMLNTTKIFVINILHGELGYQFPLFYIPSIFILFTFYLKRLSKPTLLIIIYLTVSTLLFLVIFAGDATRYFFPVSFLGIICLVSLINIFNDKKIEKGIYLLLSLFILITYAEEKPLNKLKELVHLSQKSVVERQLGNIFYDGDYRFFRENIPYGVNILYILPENTLIYPFYGTRYENKLIYANTDDINKITNLIDKEKIDYFMVKSKTSTYGSVFYWWDLSEGRIIPISENRIKEVIVILAKTGIIQEMGSGPGISFYKINKNTHAQN